MHSSNENISQLEVAKFNQQASTWWAPDGPAKALHILNPTRLKFISSCCELRQQRVLDIGCGAGILATALAKLGPSKVDAIDAAPAMIAAARQHTEHDSQAGNLEYHLATAEQFASQQPQPYDVITCMELLEHVPNPDSLIQACQQLLKPAGHIFFSTINRTPGAYLTAIIGAEYLLRWLPTGTHCYKDFIRPSELANSLRKHHLDLVKLQGVTINPVTKQAKLTGTCTVNYIAYAKNSLGCT